MRRSLQLSLTTCVLACAALVAACGRDEGRNDGPQVREPARGAGDAMAQKAGDATITASVKARLAADTDLSALDINVDTNGGVVMLRGTAPTTAARSRATEIASAVEGVKSVTNDLSVQAR